MTKWIAVAVSVLAVSSVALVIGWRATAHHEPAGDQRACAKTNSCLSVLAPK